METNATCHLAATTDAEFRAELARHGWQPAAGAREAGAALGGLGGRDGQPCHAADCVCGRT